MSLCYKSFAAFITSESSLGENPSFHIFPSPFLTSFDVLRSLIWKIVEEERSFGVCELSSLDFIFMQRTFGPSYDVKLPTLCLFHARSRFWFVLWCHLRPFMKFLKFGELQNHLSDLTYFWTCLVLERWLCM